MDIARLGASDWACLVDRLGVELERSAVDHGALRRRRGVVNAADLLRVILVYAATPLSLRSTAAWAAGNGVASLSDVALMYRLQNAQAWIKWLFEQALSRELGALMRSVDGCGRRLRAIDGSVLVQRGEVGWRLHAGLDLAQGRFDDLALTPLAEGERLDRFNHAAGDIVVADRGFCGARGLFHLLDQGADFIVRRGTGSRRLMLADGTPLREAAILAQATTGDGLDLPVLLPAAGKTRDGRKLTAAERRASQPRPCRLVVLSVPADKAIAARARCTRTIARKQQNSRPERLAASAFLCLLTSLPADRFDAAVIARLYRLRWQLELAFKRLKSLMNLDELQAVDERLAKTTLYAKLLLALLTQNLVAQIIALSPSTTTA